MVVFDDDLISVQMTRHGRAPPAFALGESVALMHGLSAQIDLFLEGIQFVIARHRYFRFVPLLPQPLHDTGRAAGRPLADGAGEQARFQDDRLLPDEHCVSPVKAVKASDRCAHFRYCEKRWIQQMNVTIQIPDDRAALYQKQAQARGLTVERWLLELAEQNAPVRSIANLQITNPKEWARQFRAWAGSHDPKTPVLSDEAMSRESIYPDRI